MRRRLIVACGVLGGVVALGAATGGAQPAATPDATLARTLPALAARLAAIERAQVVALGALARGGRVDEAAFVQQVAAQVDSPRSLPDSDPDIARAYAAVGPRLAGLLRRGHRFHREVLGVFVSEPPSARRQALDAVLDRYRRDTQFALPDAPKDMSVLYDHPYTSFEPPRPGETEPRRNLPYPRITGTVWALHWYELAVQDALEAEAAEREQALDTVTGRLRRKLTGTTPPDAFPTELPLAPSIAPGLVALHDRSAAVLDNLNILTDVIADTLVHARGAGRQAAVDRVVSEFLRRDFRCVQVDDWITVALRHSIFEQGGPARGPFRGNERNSFFGAHAQHFGPKRALPPCDPR